MRGILAPTVTLVWEERRGAREKTSVSLARPFFSLVHRDPGTGYYHSS